MSSKVNKVLPATKIMLQPHVLTRSMLANFTTTSLTVNQDKINNKFYIEMNNSKAFVDYETQGTKIKLLHTEVPEIFRGRGVAKVLANEVFTYAIKNNLKVHIVCDYLQNYYETNKEKFKTLQLI